MFYAPDLRALRQDVVEMAPPPGRVFAFSELLRPGPIKDDLNSLSDAACRLRFGSPNRLYDLQDKSRIDRLHRELPYDGCCVRRQRVDPLVPVLGVAPGGLMRGNVALRCLLKRDRLGCLQSTALATRFAFLNGVDAVLKEALALSSGDPGFSKPHSRERP